MWCKSARLIYVTNGLNWVQFWFPIYEANKYLRGDQEKLRFRKLERCQMNPHYLKCVALLAGSSWLLQYTYVQYGKFLSDTWYMYVIHVQVHMYVCVPVYMCTWMYYILYAFKRSFYNAWIFFSVYVVPGTRHLLWSQMSIGYRYMYMITVHLGNYPSMYYMYH